MKFSKLFWMGLLIFVLTGLFLIGIMYVQDITLKKSNYSFTVIFANVQGLNEGDDVNMLGKRIGKVSRAKIIGQKIAVELSIDNSFAFKIPVDSKIEVKSEGLMGSKYVSINPGVNDKKYILAGETVEGQREYDFSEITPGIVPITQDIGVFARRLKATLGEEEKDRIRNTILNIESLTSELDGFVKGYRDVLSKSERENLSDIVTNLKTASETIKEKVDNDLSQILSGFKNVSDQSEDLKQAIINLKSSSESLNSSSKKFESILNKIDSGEGTLGKMVNDPGLYDNLNALSQDGRELVQDFKDNPTKYMKAYWKGKK
ncbi:MAG: MCE family protein [Candidatus Marinimicrobia bacterium]|jgi:phospholipid/cholesterol/gamma-HCH transport system substrate-binding protein|nr:MCE family protein [Candidatus Neomarinimicrobiota bacterium]MBT5956664.1 MCE family protein [Candidatus Neomarinimicrobiota bacterium]MBT6871024.1 MCE family protein [Candidatus Neomarinimicrobiota bacterium]|tara:strand:- start:2120 stop:3073 length:954 start_codon:yes stop_codon:yes gene_type:complete